MLKKETIRMIKESAEAIAERLSSSTKLPFIETDVGYRVSLDEVVSDKPDYFGKNKF